MSLDTFFKDELAIHLQQKRIKNPRDNSYIRLSDSGSCSRAIAYRLLGFPMEEMTSHSLMTFEIGHAIHEMVQTWLVDMNLIKAEKVLVNRNGSQAIDWIGNAEDELVDHDLRVAGHFDGCTEPVKLTNISGHNRYIQDNNGERRIIEIKSITNRPKLKAKRVYPGVRFGKWEDIEEGQSLKDFGDITEVKHFPGSWSQLEHPKPEHIAQASMYAYIKGIPRIFFIYVAKDGDPNGYEEYHPLNMPIKVFDIPIDMEMVELLKIKFSNIWNKVDAFRDHLKQLGLAESYEKNDRIYWNLDKFHALDTNQKDKLCEILPDREFFANKLIQDFDCKYCAYRAECYRDIFQLDKASTLDILRPDALANLSMEGISLT